MATTNRTESTLVDRDDVHVEMHECYAKFVAYPSALIEAWLVLPEWVPSFPKRRSHSFEFQGWWGWRLDEDEQESDRERYPVAGWRIERKKGGVFELTVQPRHFRIYLGGPYDTGAPPRAVAFHRRMVRARQDESFSRFMAAALKPPKKPQRKRPKNAE